MTNETALVILDSIFKKEEKPLYKELSNLYRSALEKQIPKKLVETRCRLKCPSCNHILTDKGCIKPNLKYCYKCGQAIDFSEVTE